MNILKRKYRFFWILLAVFMMGTTAKSLAQNGYQYVKEVSINGSQVQGSHSNFPLLIDITDPNLQAHVQNPNGYDIIFASDPNGNNILDHEIESYNAGNGNLIAWVRVPNLSSSTTLYMFYGNPNVSSNPSSTSTWDNDFKTVMHLNNNANDATSNLNDGTRNGQVSNATGKINGAQDFNPTYSLGFFTYNLDTPGKIKITNNNSLGVNGNITISAWVNVDDFERQGFINPQSAGHTLITKGNLNESYSTSITSNGSLVFGSNENSNSLTTSNSTITAGSWQYVTFVKTAGGLSIYNNGTKIASNNNTTSFSTNNGSLQLGASDNDNIEDPLDGRLDEVRISSTARSQGWIATEYNNQSNPDTFYNFGIEQEVKLNGVKVTKTVDTPNPEELETITYTVKAENTGEIPVSGVQLKDNLPQGLDFIMATPSQGSYSNSTGVWDVGSIPVNGSETLTIEAEVQFGQQGNTITNTASLSAIDQTDQNPSNDSDSAPISVQYSGGNGPPPSGCQGLPTLRFNVSNRTLESGSPRQVGAVYKYNNVLSGIYARVTIKNKTNITLNDVDNDADNPNAFRPALNVGSGRGYVDFKIDFFKNGTNTPTNIDYFVLSATSVNGDKSGARRRYELVGFSSSASYTVATSNKLQENHSDPLFDIFESTADNIHQGNPLDYPEGIVSLNYKSTSSFQIRAGMVDNQNTNVGSQLDFDFNPCIPNAFPGNPMPSANNSDIAITKTVNNSSPSEGDIVTYTLDVQNNGPEDATEVLIKDPLPNGLSYNSSSATAGTYNNTNGKWNIGDIANGNSETLTITAKVTQGSAGSTINNIARVDALNQTDPNQGNQQDNAEITVQSGVEVSGIVYSDENHNGTFDSGEDGLSGVTMVLHDTDNGSCKSVQTDGNGSYSFGNVSAGNYELIEAAGENTPTPGSCPPNTADPTGYISTTPNSQQITVNNNPVSLNFGNFKGIKVSGSVFKDDGAGGGTANDILQNGGEAGLANITIAANTGGNTIGQTSTAGDGSFTLYLSDSDAPNGSTVKIKEINTSTLFSVGGSPGNTGGNYSRQDDQVTFTVSSGSTYSGLVFADVKKSLLFTDGQQNILSGSSGTFPHKFQAKTDGTVSFSIQSNNNPQSNNFSPVLYQDDNCNQSIDSGESILTNSDTITLTKGQSVCLVLKVLVPQAASNGDTGNLTLNASFALAGTSPTVQQGASRTDIINVTDSNTGLMLSKSVDKSQALPGEVLTYTITYTNNGTQPVTTLEITDNVPAYTTYNSASCNSSTLPNNLTNCSISAPGGGNTGIITWTFTGDLQPGSSGTVTYEVTIEN